MGQAPASNNSAAASSQQANNFTSPDVQQQFQQFQQFQQMMTMMQGTPGFGMTTGSGSPPAKKGKFGSVAVGQGGGSSASNGGLFSEIAAALPPEAQSSKKPLGGVQARLP